MPSLYCRVETPSLSILDTVTNQVVTGLLDELDLVNTFKDSVYVLQSFSAISQYDDGSGSVSLNKNRCDVAVSYILDKSQVRWPEETPYTTTAYGVRSDKKGNHSPIFCDPAANILIEHYTIACGIEMEFKMNFQTFDDACRAFDMIQSRYRGTLIQTPFDISFSYPVSMAMFKFLNAAYEAKQAYSTKTLLDYINDNKVTEISFDVRKSQLNDLEADKALMVRCQQLNCVAQLTMDQREPEVNRIDQLPDNFSINFSLMFQFGRPNLVVIHTPISVDNTVLPYHLFENLIVNYHYNPNVAGVYQDLMVHDYMKRSYGDYNASARIVRLPSYDDWFVVDKQYSYYEYRPILIAHFTLDGPVTTIDLKQLDDLQLHTVVQDILKATGSAVFDYGALFNIGVYADNLRLGEELVSIDENLILTITSNRLDRSYHLVISETTAIAKTDPKWDSLLIKYRHFFPMTIERNLQHLIDKRYFYVSYEDGLLALISHLNAQGQLRVILTAMVAAGEDTNELFSYTQNPAQLADYLAYKQSAVENYVIPTVETLPVGLDPTALVEVNLFYSDKASIFGRSLLVAFLEQCLLHKLITTQNIPAQYLSPNQTIYPYSQPSGGYYGFNTPIRVFQYNIRTE